MSWEGQTKCPKIRPHGPYRPKNCCQIFLKPLLFKYFFKSSWILQKSCYSFFNSIVQIISNTLRLWLHLAIFWYDHSSIHFFSHLSNYKDCTDLKVVILRSHFKVYMRKKMVFFLMWKLQFNWSLAVFIFFLPKQMPYMIAQGLVSVLSS